MLTSKSKNLLFRTGLDLLRQNETNSNNTASAFNYKTMEEQEDCLLNKSASSFSCIRHVPGAATSSTASGNCGYSSKQRCMSPSFLQIISDIDETLKQVKAQEEFKRNQAKVNQRISSEMHVARNSKRRLRFSTSPNVSLLSSHQQEGEEEVKFSRDAAAEEIDMEKDSFSFVIHRSNNASSATQQAVHSVLNRSLNTRFNDTATTFLNRSATSGVEQFNEIEEEEEEVEEEEEEEEEMNANQSTLEDDERFARELMEQEQAELLERLRHQQVAALEQLEQGGQTQWRRVIEEENNEDEEAEEEEANDGNNYDALLELGERLGDVRKERWRARSHLVIEKLASIAYSARPAFYKDELCVVCQCDFEDWDEIKLMPNCIHCFHVECISTWLKDNDCCVSCKAAVE